jgi:adenylyltransferase/sulfurtransferase
LEQNADQFPKENPVVTICYRGHRSLQAAQYLTDKYPALTVYHMAAGMDGWKIEMGQKHLVQE